MKVFYLFGRVTGITIGLVLGFVGFGLGLAALALLVIIRCIRIAIRRRLRRHRARSRARAWDRHPSVQDYADLSAELADIPFDLLRLHDNERKSA